MLGYKLKQDQDTNENTIIVLKDGKLQKILKKGENSREYSEEFKIILSNN